MHITETAIPTLSQKEAIYRLWNNEYPAQLAYNSIAELDKYLDALTNATHYFLTDIRNNICGWAFTFLRDGEKWFAIIIDSSIQKQGYGATLLQHIKAAEPTLNGWVTDHGNYLKPDGTQYLSPLPFYLKNGFNIVPQARLETQQLSAARIVWCANN